MYLSIPKPCHEDWNKMTANEMGAFCQSCAKTVVDFSEMSDEQIIQYFEQAKGQKTCGRFRASQLAPYELKVNLRSIMPRSFPKIFALTLFVVFSSLFICKSDTGDTIPLQVVCIESVDTTVNIALTEIEKGMDTTAVESPAIEEDDEIIRAVYLGQVALPVKVIGDTILHEPIKAEPEMMMKGEVVNYKTPAIVPSCNPETKPLNVPMNERGTERKIMGKVMLRRE